MSYHNWFCWVCVLNQLSKSGHKHGRRVVDFLDGDVQGSCAVLGNYIRERLHLIHSKVDHLQAWTVTAGFECHTREVKRHKNLANLLLNKTFILNLQNKCTCRLTGHQPSYSNPLIQIPLHLVQIVWHLLHHQLQQAGTQAFLKKGFKLHASLIIDYRIWLVGMFFFSTKVKTNCQTVKKCFPPNPTHITLYITGTLPESSSIVMLSVLFSLGGEL